MLYHQIKFLLDFVSSRYHYIKKYFRSVDDTELIQDQQPIQDDQYIIINNYNSDTTTIDGYSSDTTIDGHSSDTTIDGYSSDTTIDGHSSDTTTIDGYSSDDSVSTYEVLGVVYEIQVPRDYEIKDFGIDAVVLVFLMLIFLT